jgi:3-keto-disaccharide hydrolase
MFKPLAISTCILLGSPLLVAADDFKLEPGFERLDNGKDLDGWTGNKDGWSVVEGAIVLDAKKAKGNIYSEKTNSKNCVIRLQFKAADNADSGFFVHGSQLQVRDYPKAGPKNYAGPAKPAGQWNELELDFTDGTAVVKLNGEVIEKSFKAGGNAKQGVGLQKERGDFAFRYIVIKEKTK